MYTEDAIVHYSGSALMLAGVYTSATIGPVLAKWSYVTASPNHHDPAVHILSPVLFMQVGHPNIPLLKTQRIILFTLLLTLLLSLSLYFCHNNEK